MAIWPRLAHTVAELPSGKPVILVAKHPDIARVSAGELAAAQRYLDWEMGILVQLDEAERGNFRRPGKIHSD